MRGAKLRDSFRKSLSSSLFLFFFFFSLLFFFFIGRIFLEDAKNNTGKSDNDEHGAEERRRISSLDTYEIRGETWKPRSIRARDAISHCNVVSGVFLHYT